MGFKLENLPKQPEKKYSDMTCDGCNESIKSVYGDQYLQPDEAVILRIEGGYGCFFDPCCEDEIESPLYVKLFCKKCFRKMCEQWPTFMKTIEDNGCSSSVGHHCAQLQMFVWEEPISHCYEYCRKCGRHGSYTVGLEKEDDIYSRRIVNCLTGCGTTAPGLWAWEVSDYIWSVLLWNNKTKKTVVLTSFPTKEEAETFMAKYMDVNLIEKNEIHVEKMAQITA